MFLRRSFNHGAVRAGLFSHVSAPSGPSSREPFNALLCNSNQRMFHSLLGYCLESTAPVPDYVGRSLFARSGVTLCSMKVKESATLPYAMSIRSFIHSGEPKKFEAGRDNRNSDFNRGVVGGGENSDFNKRVFRGGENSDFNSGVFNQGANSDFNRGVIGGGENSDFNKGVFGGGENSNFNNGVFNQGANLDFNRGVNRGENSFFNRGIFGKIGNSDFSGDTRNSNFNRDIDRIGRNFREGLQFSKYNVEQNADIVHVKMLRNNTFVTVTDSKGNTKFGLSAGKLDKGGKVSRYAAEACAELAGRFARDRGIKSVVVKVNGFTYFKKKKQAILGLKEGYSHSRGDKHPIVYIEDTTRRPHNGCRLRKKRRV